MFVCMKGFQGINRIMSMNCLRPQIREYFLSGNVPVLLCPYTKQAIPIIIGIHIQDFK